MAKKRKAKKVKIKPKRAVQKTKRKKRSIRNQDVPVAAMSEREKEQNTQAQFLRDAFEGMKGRQPKSAKELNQWLTTDEGKEATMFSPSSLSRWGETGRS
jgi:hypothetical protein